MAKTVKVKTSFNTKASTSRPRMSTKKSTKMTGTQQYKLQKMSLKNQRIIANKKADTVRAVGSAVAQNFVPTAVSAAGSIASTKAVDNANTLISAGTSNVQEKNNATDTENEYSPNYRE